MNGEDISQVLNADGPIVKCVLLRCGTTDDDLKKKAAASPPTTSDSRPKDDDDDTTATPNGGESSQPVRLQHLIEEVEVDTTPKKQAVAQLLGGPITFLGQYEEEGVMLMVRRPTEEEEQEEEEDDDHENKEAPLQLNPHTLQPPFDDVDVRGDILIMKVAPTPEDEDNDGDTNNNDENNNHDEDAPQKEESKIATAAMASSPSSTNDDFFLDYTKEEYIAFASRTDVVAPPEVTTPEEEEEEVSEGEGEEESGSEDEEENDNDEDFDIGEDGEYDSDEEEDDSPVAMMNLIMGQVLRRFQEEHGRGPDTRELLDLRSALAEKLGVEVPEADELEADWDQKAIKRKRAIVVEEPSSNAEHLKSPVKSILTRKRTVDENETNNNLKASEDDNDTDEPEAKRVKWNQNELTEETILFDNSAIVTPSEDNPSGI